MRTLLTVPQTWYVNNVAGSDANDGSTTALAFKTIQAAADTLADNFDFTRAAQPTIQLATTGVDYAENVYLPRYVGSLGWQAGYTYPVIQGDLTNNGLVVVRPATGSAFIGVNCSPWIISSLMVRSYNQWGINSDACSMILLQNVNFGVCGLGHMCASYGGFIETLNGPYSISGSAQTHINVSVGGIYVSQGNLVTFQAWPTFLWFAAGVHGGRAECGGLSFANSQYTSSHPGTVNNDGTALLYPTLNGNWP